MTLLPLASVLLAVAAASAEPPPPIDFELPPADAPVQVAAAPALRMDAVVPPVPMDEPAELPDSVPPVPPDPPPVFEPPPPAVVPAPAAPAPAAPAVAPAPKKDPPARVPPPPAAPAKAHLLQNVRLIDGGFGTLLLAPTGLDGSVAALSGAGLFGTSGRWFAGVVLFGGGPESVGLTWGGARGGASVYEWRWLDVTASMTLGVGGATHLASTGKPESTAVLVWQPEVGARARLLPWLRVSAGVGYRMMNAGEWTGPSGDALGGFTMLLGLEFGTT